MEFSKGVVPELGDPRISFNQIDPTGDPQEWGVTYVGDNGLERYEDDYEEYSCGFFSVEIVMFIDGDPVHSESFSIYQGEHAPDDDIAPSEATIYANFVKRLAP